MTQLKALETLLEQVVAETADVAEPYFVAFGGSVVGLNAYGAYSGYLDAAKALHEAVLPECEYGYDGSIAWVKLPGLRTSYRHDTRGGYTARAWLIAILKALIAIEKESA